MMDDWQRAGWPVVRIRDIGRLHGGGTPSRKRPEYFQGEIPWITGQDIPDNQVTTIEQARDYVTEEAIAESATRVVPAGAVLITTRVSVGKTAVAGRPICFSQDVTALLIHSEAIALPAYVAHYLRSRQPALLQKNQGSTIAGITRDSLALEQIPLPPLSEQQRIVDILQEAEEIRRLRAQAEAKTAELIPALFYHFFGDAEHQFETRLMRELVSEFRYGTSQSSSDRGVTTLRIPNILGERISFEDLVTVDERDASLERLALQTGDMLFVRTNGNPDYIGRCGVFDITDAERELGSDAPVIFASYLIRARLKLDLMRPWFLHAFLRSPIGRARVLKQARTAAGQYNINTEGLGSIRVPIPPLKLQDAFLSESAATQQISEMVRLSDKQQTALEKALSAHAFTGQLTEEWRENYQKKLASEARDRDAALQQAGAAHPLSRRATIQEMDRIWEDRTDGIYAELNHEQRALLSVIQRRGEEPTPYFTAVELANRVEGSLQKNPQAIESHLAVFAARGILIPVSCEEHPPDTTLYVFGNAYRLPLEDRNDSLTTEEGVALLTEEGEPLVSETLLGERRRVHELGRLVGRLDRGNRKP